MGVIGITGVHLLVLGVSLGQVDGTVFILDDSSTKDDICELVDEIEVSVSIMIPNTKI